LASTVDITQPLSEMKHLNILFSIKSSVLLVIT